MFVCSHKHGRVSFPSTCRQQLCGVLYVPGGEEWIVLVTSTQASSSDFSCSLVLKASKYTVYFLWSNADTYISRATQRQFRWALGAFIILLLITQTSSAYKCIGAGFQRRAISGNSIQTPVLKSDWIQKTWKSKFCWRSEPVRSAA